MRGQKPVAKPLGDLLVLPNAGANVTTPPYPKTLPEGLARECWDEVTRELMLRNIYDGDCRDMVEAYCIQRARFIEANERVQEMGLVVKKKGRMKGTPTTTRSNPYVIISNQAYDRMVRLGAELGLTPVRRERAVRVNSAGGKAGAEKFLKGGL